MDFRQNFQQAMNNRSEPTVTTDTTDKREKVMKSRNLTSPKWLTILNAVALIGIVLLLIASIFAFTQIKKGDDEGKYVDTSLYQAVFLNNGQVYFGNVTSLNNSFMRLNNVYYLTQASTTATQSASSDYTLVKLGCQQIHYPTDQMIINRSQVSFWENLNNSGKVAKSIADYKKQYPNGNCNQTSSTTQSSTNSAAQTQNATGTTPTTPTAPTTKK